MKAIILSVIMLMASLTTAMAQSDNADAIIRKHIEAIGGADNWSKIRSMKRVGSVGDQESGVKMTTTTVQDKASRMDITGMGKGSYIIVTPKEGWVYLPMQGADKVISMTADQIKIHQSSLDLKGGLFLNKSEIAKAEFIGKDTVKNIRCLKVKITGTDGQDQVVFFDAATYYIIRTERKMEIRGEEEEEDFNYSNFQKQPEGIVIAMTVTSPMLQDAEIAYKSIEINKPINDDIFKPNPNDPK